MTDASGYATLPRLPQHYDLRIDVVAPRFALPIHDAPIPLEVSELKRTVVVSPALAATLSGTVSMGGVGKPIPGAEVSVYNQDFNTVDDLGTCGATGHFTIHRLVPD